MIFSTTSNPPDAMPSRFVFILLHTVLVSGFYISINVSQLAAQPEGAGGPGGPGGLGNSFAIDDVSVAYSYSADGDVERNGKLGSAEISRFEFETSFSLPAPESWRFSSAISWSHDDFKLTGPVPLPDKLQEFGLNFMAMKNLSKEIGPGWSAMAILNPSFASDSGEISGDSFNFTGIAIIGKKVSPNFQWNAGVVGMSRGKNKILPVVGLRWKFARDWSLLLGYPRTGISYDFSGALSVTAGAMFHAGGSYYISKAPASAPGLRDTYLEYQEIRGGVRVEYKIGEKFSVEMDAGMMIDRSFDYNDRNLDLDGKSVGYGRLSLRYQF